MPIPLIAPPPPPPPPSLRERIVKFLATHPNEAFNCLEVYTALNPGVLDPEPTAPKNLGFSVGVLLCHALEIPLPTHDIQKALTALEVEGVLQKREHQGLDYYGIKPR